MAFSENMKGPFSATGADTDGGGVTVTQAAPGGANQRYVVTGIQCSADAAALVTIESPASTVIWRKRYAGAFTMSETFAPDTVKGAVAGAVLVKISAATTNSEANIQGYTLGGR